MKIGFIFDDTLDSTDGVQQYILTLGRWFADHGHEVHYIVGQTERSDIPHVFSASRNVKVRFNGNRMSVPLPSDSGRLRRYLDREHFDVLHVQVPYSPFMAGRVIGLVSSRTAVVGTFHVAPNSFVATIGNHLLSRITLRTLRRFDTIVSVSRTAAEFAKETYRINTDIIPNTVDISPYRMTGGRGSVGGVPIILFIGRLVPRKACGILLEAVSILRQENPEVAFRVQICGRGPLQATYENYVQAHNLSNIVEFKGYVSEEQKISLLQQATLAVFPSSGGESFGIVLIEAMAADGPVILGADNPGYRSVLAPYPDLLFPVGDSRALAESMRRFLADKAIREAAQAWQQSYVRQFDVPVVADKLLRVYKKCIEARLSS